MQVRHAFALGMLLAALIPVGLGTTGARSAPARIAAIAWPKQYDGMPLTRLPLAAAERRFALGIPGAIARFTDGRRELVLRSVERPTRMLHPAADCFRGLGYAVTPPRLIEDEDRRAWSCFDATRDGRTRRVCERIQDSRGQAWTDVSAWYWAAALSRTSGPWMAVTRVWTP